MWGPLWPQLMWRVPLTVSNTMMWKGLCYKKVFIQNLSALFCANLVISRVEIICLELRCLSCMLVVLGRELWKALTCGVVTFGEPLGHVITLCGQILVSCRVLCVLVCCVCCGVCVCAYVMCAVCGVLFFFVCVYMTVLCRCVGCVWSPVCTDTTRTCVSTCARFASTHGSEVSLLRFDLNLLRMSCRRIKRQMSTHRNVLMDCRHNLHLPFIFSSELDHATHHNHCNVRVFPIQGERYIFLRSSHPSESHR